MITSNNAESGMQLLVHISNGNAIHDTKLKFEFLPRDITRVWVVKLPRLRNPDAFAEQVDERCWQLQLAVIGPTQPFEIQQYDQESVARWLENVFNKNFPDVSELLILAHGGRFTISIYQP